MAPAFPLAKLASLLLKQISKPLANRLKRQAKSSHSFRTWVCMPPAQLYHWVDVNIKMRMMNLGKPVEVPKLNEAMAIELGAELLGEGVVFLTAAGCLIAEYMRSTRKERDREAAKEGRADDVESRVYELEYQVSEQEARLRELSRLLYIEKKIKMAPPAPSVPSSPPTFPPTPPKPRPPSSSPPPPSPPSSSTGTSEADQTSSGGSDQANTSPKSSTLMDKAIEDVKSIMVFL